jgi:hypothetical protein
MDIKDIDDIQLMLRTPFHFVNKESRRKHFLSELLWTR